MSVQLGHGPKERKYVTPKAATIGKKRREET
jgi:hypothetical protein